MKRGVLAPGRLGFLVGVLAATAFFAWYQGGQLAYHVVVFVIVLTAVVLVTGVAPLSRIQARRRVPSTPVAAGDTVVVSVTVELPRWWPWLYLAVRDRLPLGIVAAGASSFVAFPWFQREVTVTYRLLNVPRGIHRFSDVVLASGDPFGFLTRRRVLEVPQELEVWPPTVPLSFVAALPREWEGGLRERTVMVDESSELRGIRDFVTGDRLSRIHWQTTAKTGQFKVKQFEPLTVPELEVLVDHPGVFTPHDFETALACAGSLADFGLQREQNVALTLLGADLTLPARNGPEHLKQIMRTLSEVRWRREDVPGQLLLPAASSHARLIITGRDPAQIHRGRMPGAMVLYVGRQGVPGAVTQLSDLPRVLAQGFSA